MAMVGELVQTQVGLHDQPPGGGASTRPARLPRFKNPSGSVAQDPTSSLANGIPNNMIRRSPRCTLDHCGEFGQRVLHDTRHARDRAWLAQAFGHEHRQHRWAGPQRWVRAPDAPWQQWRASRRPDHFFAAARRRPAPRHLLEQVRSLTCARPAATARVLGKCGAGGDDAGLRRLDRNLQPVFGGGGRSLRAMAAMTVLACGFTRDAHQVADWCWTR